MNFFNKLGTFFDGHPGNAFGINLGGVFGHLGGLHPEEVVQPPATPVYQARPVDTAARAAPTSVGQVADTGDIAGKMLAKVQAQQNSMNMHPQSLLMRLIGMFGHG